MNMISRDERKSQKGIKKFNSLYNDVLREFYGSEETALDLLAKNINNLEK